MIVRVGLDLVEIDRIAVALRNPRFRDRILTPAERELCATTQTIAGRWAAKEAIAKAIGLHLAWHEVEILPDSNGAPTVRIFAPDWDPGRYRIHLSITHERTHAAAVAILEQVSHL